MSFSFEFSPWWYVLFAAFLAGWATLMLVRRRDAGKNEKWEQAVLGALGFCTVASMEVFATSTGLWNYAPANWPVMLWPTYFMAILFGYQLLKTVERFLHA
jgi:hypothetical protein